MVKCCYCHHYIVVPIVAFDVNVVVYLGQCNMEWTKQSLGLTKPPIILHSSQTSSAGKTLLQMLCWGLVWMPISDEGVMKKAPEPEAWLGVGGWGWLSYYTVFLFWRQAGEKCSHGEPGGEHDWLIKTDEDWASWLLMGLFNAWKWLVQSEVTWPLALVLQGQQCVRVFVWHVLPT